MDVENFVIRPVNLGDLKCLYEISGKAGIGFTSLVPDKLYLKNRLKLSVDSFKEKLPPEQRLYLFVCEDLAIRKIIGICGLVACVGYEQAFYNYQLSTVVQSCEKLNISLEHTVLRLVTNFQEASELVSLWVDPDYRGKNIGKNLSLCCFLFMAQYLEWFGMKIIVDMRGVCDESGFSPFWDAIGKHFFDMSFSEADNLTMTLGKQYISDLVSREPIYYDLLPLAAQKVVAIAHDEAQPARNFFESEGLKFHDHIDIFDGGPVLSAERAHIKTLVNNKLTKIENCIPSINNGTPAILYNNKIDARFTTSQVIVTDSGTLVISEETAKIMGLKTEDQIRYCEI